MIDAFTFLNDSLFWPIVIGACIMGCFFVWKEWHHFASARFWIKIIIIGIALFALVMIALEPAISSSPTSNKAIILTANYETARLDSLKSIHKKIKVISYTHNSPLFKENTTVNSVFILGEGLEPYDLWQLETKKVSYLGDKIPSGIIKYTYNYKATEGQQLNFKGLYNRPEKGTQLLLQGPGDIALDSLLLDTLKQQPFQLKTVLKATGHYTYQLIKKEANGERISQHPIPVEVKKQEPLKILIINGFPTFESKYLKNFLAENGHEVLVRSQVTKARFKYEYFNTKKRKIGPFIVDNLKAYDLVIIDANSLSSLGSTTREAFKTTITEEGLGVLIQANKSFFNTTKSLAGFSFLRDTKKNVLLKNAPKINIEKYPFQFKNQFNLETLVNGNANSILAGYKRKGLGRVGTTVLSHTYTLVLKGESKMYQQLWSAIIEGISKQNEPKTEWISNFNLAKKDTPFEFQLKLKNDEFPEVKTNRGYRIAMRNTIHLPKLWIGKTYPRKSGWQSLHVMQDSSSVFNYYVQDTLAWSAKTTYDKMIENKRFSGKANFVGEAVFKLEPVNLLWFFVAFLVSMGLLWVLPKVF